MTRNYGRDSKQEQKIRFKIPTEIENSKPAIRKQVNNSHLVNVLQRSEIAFGGHQISYIIKTATLNLHLT